MKKNRKVQLATALLGFAAAAAGVFAWNGGAVEAQAASASFAMRTGASVRAKENESGIRWETNVTKAWFENTDNIPTGATEISFGTLVADADVVKKVGDVIAGGERVVDIPCGTTSNFFPDDVDTFKYYSAIKYNNVDVADQTAAYAEELIARSYVKYKAAGATEFTYVYAEAKDTARCMRAVALVELETTDINDALMQTYLGTNKNSALTVDGDDGFFETAVETVSSDYSVAYNGAKKVGTLTDGKLTLSANFAYNENVVLNLFDANGNYAKTAECKYITKFVTNNSFATDLLLTKDTGGYFTLKGDIELSETWTNANKFSGTFDGNNFKITGLNGTGLFHTLAGSAVIKNVSIIDANLNDKSGAIATVNNTSGTVTIENVYVSLAAQKFSEAEVSNTTYEATANAYKGGLIGYGATNSENELVVKNTVVYMPETLTTACGFVYGYSNNVNSEGGNVTTENCTFIGGNGQALGVNSATTAATVTNTNSVYCDAVAAHETYKTNWSEMQKAAYNANHEYVQLGKDTFASYFQAAAGKTMSQIIVLTDNVELPVNMYGTEAGPDFTGVLDGKNHKITGLIYSGGVKFLGSLTNLLEGSIKNVAFIGAQTSAVQKAGLIAKQILQNAYLENVYIEVTKITNNINVAPIAFAVGKNAGLSLKDVVVYVHGENTGDIGTTSQAVVASVSAPVTIKTINLVYIHENESVKAVNNAGESVLFGNGTTGFKGSNAKADFDAAVAKEAGETGKVTLTDFIKGVIYPTNSENNG